MATTKILKCKCGSKIKASEEELKDWTGEGYYNSKTGEYLCEFCLCGSQHKSKR